MPAETSIGIRKTTKDRLEFIKVHPRETFDDIITRLLDLYDKQEKK
jgi:hypothetical protein